MLGNHRNDFRMSQENLAHFSRCHLTILQRERNRHGSTNPKVAFFQMRKKLAAESQSQKCGHGKKGDADADRERTVIQRESQRGIVKTVQHADDNRFGFLHVLREKYGSEHWA